MILKKKLFFRIRANIMMHGATLYRKSENRKIRHAPGSTLQGDQKQLIQIISL